MGSQILPAVESALLRPTACAADRNSRLSLASWLHFWLSEASLQKAVVAIFQELRLRADPESRLPVFIGYRHESSLAEISVFGLPAVAPHYLAGLCPAPRLSLAEISVFGLPAVAPRYLAGLCPAPRFYDRAQSVCAQAAYGRSSRLQPEHVPQVARHLPAIRLASGKR